MSLDRLFLRVARACVPFSAEAPSAPGAGGRTSSRWIQRFVDKIYARHNRARNVVKAVARVLATLDGNSETWGLNIGAGATKLHPRVLNLDIDPGGCVDVLGDAHCLPFGDASLQCVISQEVFEHLPDPVRATREVARVLKPGGLFYLQVPFIIGFHSGPNDFWRFTAKGLEELVRRADFEVLEVTPAVGAGTSMYRISVEFLAALAAAIHWRCYLPTKAAAALLLAPLRWADVLTDRDSPTNRIPAGFFVIARKS